MARVATDKMGLTMAEDADLVWVTGMCKELGLRGRLMFEEVTLELLL